MSTTTVDGEEEDIRPGPSRRRSSSAQEAVNSERKVAAACGPCRALRIRCSNTSPCCACIERGTPDRCVKSTIGSSNMYHTRERNEIDGLKNEADRLQKVFDDMRARQTSWDPTGKIDVPPSSFARRDSSGSVRPGTTRSDASSSQHTIEESDLLSHDLARRLSRLTIKTFGVEQQEVGPLEGVGPSIVAEVKTVLNDSPPSTQTGFVANLSSPQPPPSIGLLPLGRTRLTALEIMAKLPPRAKADACSQYYYKVVDWYMHALPYYLFRGHRDNVWAAQAAGTAADPVSLATCFAVWGVGLDLMQVYSAGGNQPCTYEDNNSETWLDLAAEALVLGNFLEAPTLDSTRALLVLGIQWALVGNGDKGSNGITYLALTVQCCFQLQLHRDPDKLPQHFSIAEAEERRRLFWSTYALVYQSESLYGRKFGMLRKNEVDCKLPRDVSDEMIEYPDAPREPETIMTFVIHDIKIHQLTEEISEEVYGVKPVTYAQILEFDKKIQDLEKQVPAPYRFDASSTYDTIEQPVRALRCFVAHGGLIHERFRLHRPYLLRSYFDPSFAFSRNECLRTARDLVQIQLSPICAAPLVSFNYKAVCACIVLALDCLFAPHGAEVAEQRDSVEKVLVVLEAYTTLSTVIRRGIAIVRHLLTKLDPVSSATRSLSSPELPAYGKRTRLSPSASSQYSSPPPPSSYYGSPPPPSIPEEEEEEEDSPRRRKVPAPAPLPVTLEDLNTFGINTYLNMDARGAPSQPTTTAALPRRSQPPLFSFEPPTPFYPSPAPSTIFSPPAPLFSPPTTYFSPPTTFSNLALDSPPTTHDSAGGPTIIPPVSTTPFVVPSSFAPDFDGDFGKLFEVPPLKTKQDGETVPYSFEGMPLSETLAFTLYVQK